MSATTATTAAITTQAEVANLAAEIVETAADLRVALFSLRVDFFASTVGGHKITAHIGSSEPGVDLLADALGLAADSGLAHDRYVRRGGVRGVTVEVWTARTTPRCSCGNACDHKPVSA